MIKISRSQLRKFILNEIKILLSEDINKYGETGGGVSTDSGGDEYASEKGSTFTSKDDKPISGVKYIGKGKKLVGIFYEKKVTINGVIKDKGFVPNGYGKRQFKLKNQATVPSGYCKKNKQSEIANCA